MKKLLRNLIVEAISLWVVDLLFGGIWFEGIVPVIETAAMLAILNSFLKPLLKILSLPVTILTLGLFSLVVNGFILYLAFDFVQGAYIASMTAAILAAIVLAVVNGFVESVLTDD